MDTCEYIQEICNADFRSTATDQQRVIFFTPFNEVVRDYEKYCVQNMSELAQIEKGQDLQG